MRILIICSSIARDVGGPARSIQGLVAALEGCGVETYLMSLKPLDEPWVSGVKHYRTAGTFSWRGVRRAVENAIDEIRPDLIHVQTIWMLNLHMAVVAARRKKIPYILSMRGAISEWALSQSRWRKKLALLTYQGYDLHHAAALHATSSIEAGRIRAIGHGDRPIVICPNGVNLPESLPPWTNGKGGVKKMLFFSRIHKVKGLLDLVRAWATVGPQGWILEIVGNDETNYWPVVASEIARLGVAGQIVRSDFVPDEKKWEKYRSADCFVLPSYSENFGIVVAEALYAGLPVITTTGTPWKDLNEYPKSGWWIEPGAEALVKTFKDVMSLSAVDLKNMGEDGHRLVLLKYSWPSIAKAMKKAYEGILS